MERAGYSKGEAVAIVSAATAMGILVPPCIFMIVLASMTNQSIGAMFVAGFLPAVVIAIALAIYNRFSWQDLPKIILASTINTAMVMLLVGTATVFSWVMTIERVPQAVAKLVTSISSAPWLFLVVSNLIFILFGAILEGLPAMIVFVPVMYPIAMQFGIDPLHYAILIIASIGIGVFLPPIGVGLFIACAIARLNIVESARYMAPYLVILGLGLLVVTYVPWFTLVLPHAFLK